MPERTPVYEAQNALRYHRQQIIRDYQEQYKCRLVTIFGVISPWSPTLFEELLTGADRKKDLHVILASPGGDGEIAVRLARVAQSRCKEFSVIVPDSAKSAGTLLTLGAHHIIMGAASDLGPVDPQIQLKFGGPFVAAKDVISAVEEAAEKVQAAPAGSGTYALYSALLSDVTAVTLQQARSAVKRTGDIIREALSSNPDRKPAEVESLAAEVLSTLVDQPSSHAAAIGAQLGLKIGLPVKEMRADEDQWERVWSLWSQYFLMTQQVYESESALQVVPWPGMQPVS